MFDYVLNIASKVSERRLSLQVKAFLNFLFIGSLTSIVFEKYYFKYSLLKIDDYEGVYRYFIDGHFFIPLVAFFILWQLTENIGTILFKLPNMYVERKFKKSVINFSVSRFSFFDTMDPTARKSMDEFIEVPRDNWVISLFEEIKKSTDYVKISQNLNIARERLNSEAVLLFRAFVSMIIYFNTIDYFGWLLFSGLMLILLFMIFVNSLAYQFIEITPVILWKMDKIIETHSKASSSDKTTG